jgi:nucleotide-binding universal stress UspA family protein
MKKILCTIDFSDSSRQALKYSAKLAKESGSPLTILYAYRLVKSNGEAVAMKKKIEADAAANFAVLEKELLAGSGISYEFRTEVGFVDDRIEEHARKNNVSFLVMGKSMSSGTKETFNELVSHLQIPLVIVP